MPKVIVDYGTIKGMVVELPSTFTCMELLSAWVAAFISHMTTNAIVSDDVLCSSIGQKNAMEALVAGIEERLAEGSPERRLFIDYIKEPGRWRFEVLRQRRGNYAAFEDSFGKECAQKAVELGLI